VLKAWEEEAFIGIMSPPLRAEYANVLNRGPLVQRFRLTSDEIRAFLFAVDISSEYVLIGDNSPIELRDPDDEIVLMTAVSGNADFIVSGDRDLLSVAEDSRLGRLRIVTAPVFLDELPDFLP
jgi:putative PIN family toxin of toxin-antitoxin system